MNEASRQLEKERDMLAAAELKGVGAKFATYTKLSGPGWLQSAITLGGGSLASSLYLGVIGGYHLLWVQPFSMVLGIIMLSAIGYVTLSSQRRPFTAINEHVNPVLGWGWALAAGAANIVWCLPQYALANSVLSQILLPGVFADGKTAEPGWIQQQVTNAAGSESWWATNADEVVVVGIIGLLSILVTWSYDRGGLGIRLYETMLKIVVGLIVVCFVAVVVVLSTSDEGLPWQEIGQGFIPDFATFIEPATSFAGLLSDIGDPGTPVREYWREYIVSEQQDVIISAAATAVGINMTFLFAYSLLRKGWTQEFRGLIKFDLATGMLIPFFLATSCVVIASAARFHTHPAKGFEIDDGTVVVPQAYENAFNKLLAGRSEHNQKLAGEEKPVMPDEPSLAEKKLASTIVRRDGFALSQALEPAGKFLADGIFGFGVLAMTMSTITILMLISGFVCCELVGLAPGGWPHRIGTLLPAFLGMLGPFVWGSDEAQFYLAVPTSVFGFVLLPLAYITFFFLMNQRSLLKEQTPTGARQAVWNLLMFISAGVASVGSVYMAYKKAGYAGVIAVGAIVLLAVLVQVNRRNTGYKPPEY